MRRHMRTTALASVAAAAALTCAGLGTTLSTRLSAQAPADAANAVHTLHVQGNVYMLVVADLHRDVAAGADEHVDVALHVQRVDGIAGIGRRLGRQRRRQRCPDAGA